MQQRERERQRQTDTHTHMLVLRMQEMREIVGDDLPFAFQNLSLDLPEYQGTPEDVAIEKCRAAFQQVHNSSHSLLLSPPLSSTLTLWSRGYAKGQAAMGRKDNRPNSE